MVSLGLNFKVPNTYEKQFFIHFGEALYKKRLKKTFMGLCIISLGELRLMNELHMDVFLSSQRKQL